MKCCEFHSFFFFSLFYHYALHHLWYKGVLSLYGCTRHKEVLRVDPSFFFVPIDSKIFRINFGVDLNFSALPCPALHCPSVICTFCILIFNLQAKIFRDILMKLGIYRHVLTLERTLFKTDSNRTSISTTFRITSYFLKNPYRIV